MNLLLDTHALFWALTSPDRLGPGCRSQIEDSSVAVWVSPISAYEMAHKHRIGKMPEALAVLPRLADHIATMGALELPLTTNHCLLAGQLDWSHRDPFDRFLAAQALSEGCHLVSLDPAFASLGGLMTLW